VTFFGSNTTWYYGGAGFTAGMADFIGAAEHEVDEDPGTESYLDCVKNRIYCAPTGNPVRPVDLFRYSADAVRSYSATDPTAYFPYDGGATNVDTWNQTGSADFGDFAHNCSSYLVQDQSICGGKLATYGPEKALLDAIGYDRTRELQTPIILGLALPALCLLRRKRMRSLR
jgi:hypothetical protein